MNRARCVTWIRDRFIYVKVVTIVIWLSWVISMARSGFTRDAEGKPIGTDHIAFYSAARLISEGRGDLIYDHRFLEVYQPKLVNQEGQLLDAYRNPPFYALLYVPTARLPFLVSFWIWTVVSLIMLWLGLGWLSTEKRFAAFVLSFSFYPVFALFGFGQNSLLSFGFLCLTFRLLERGRPLGAGLVAGLLLYKPQLLLGLGLWWLLSLRQYWKCLVGLTLTGLFWLAVSLLFVPVESRIFVEKLKEIATYDGFMYWNLCNPRGFGALISYDNKKIGDNVGLICSVVAIVCFLFFWRRHRANIPVMFAAAVFLTLWASPHTMIYEWSLALIPAVLLWDRVPEKRDDWVLIFTVSWVFLFISTPIAHYLYDWTLDPVTGHGWAIQVCVPAMGVVGIWAMCVLRPVGKLENITSSEEESAV